MASPLGTIYSRADALKRQLYDMLTNPRDAAAMLGGRIVESGRQAQALQEQTFADPNRPFRVTDPQAMARLTDMLMAGPMGFAPAGITAYHGSPYLFRQFDPAKVGTGEGAQAYGVGAGYTAEARPVAEGYARILSNRDVANQGRLNAHANAQRLANLAGDPKYAADDIRFALESTPDHPQKELLTETLRYLETGAYAKPLEKTGYLYKGDIPDEILPKFLDWDKPFKDQSSEVKEAIQKYWKENNVYGDPTKLKGEGLYDSIVAHLFGDSGRAGAQRAASNALESMGVRGIRYLDQGSRGTSGQRTSNFVPFSPEDFKVQEINDIPVEDWISKGLL